MFCCSGQQLGLIIADTQRHADEAAKQVVVTYSNVQKPLLSIEDAIGANSFFKPDFQPINQGDVNQGFAQSAHVINGSVSIGTQYHFHMETQTSKHHHCTFDEMNHKC
jgi:xanthine dehydrogenase molybdopterin-binding subunit B